MCSAKTAAPLGVGQCETVSCTWSSPPASQASETSVTVVANDGGAIPECDATNDKGEVVDVYCLPAQ